jgi:hypothetical protein
MLLQSIIIFVYTVGAKISQLLLQARLRHEDEARR